MKVCYKCGRDFPLSEFYKHNGMSDGHLNKCKQCCIKDSKDNRLSNLDYYRKYDRARGSRQSNSSLNKYRERYPNKYQAHCALNNAIRNGRLVKLGYCEKCYTTYSIVGHHCDYNRPLDVMWLCQACHLKWHSENGEGINGG